MIEGESIVIFVKGHYHLEIDNNSEGFYNLLGLCKQKPSFTQ